MYYMPLCGMYASYISTDIMCTSYYGASIYCKFYYACNLLKNLKVTALLEMIMYASYYGS